MSDRSDAELLRACGHQPKGLEGRESEFLKRRGDTHFTKWRFHCSCGYVSTFRATKKDAVEAGIHHMRKVAREIRANGGVSLRRNAPAAG